MACKHLNNRGILLIELTHIERLNQQQMDSIIEYSNEWHQQVGWSEELRMSYETEKWRQGIG